MKLNTGIYFFLASIVITAIGSWLKIKHSGGADLFLGVGMIFCVLGLAIILIGLLRRKSP